MAEVGLVTCTKEKKEVPAVPEELYSASLLFRVMKKYCEMTHDRWFILSAKHGLLEPNGEEIAPYDLILKNVSSSRKRKWAKSVFQSLRHKSLEEHTVYIYAEADYYSELLPLLDDAGISYERPLQGLTIDEYRDWFQSRL